MSSINFHPHVNRNQLISISLIAFMVGGILGGALWRFGGIYREFPPLDKWKLCPLDRFSSYEDLKKFLNTSQQGLPYYYKFVVWGGSANVLYGTVGYAVDSMQAPEYSTTNIQVEGVDEMDIVKTDGEYIYIVSGKSVIILRAYPPEDAEVLSRLELDKTISGIFVSGDKLVVFQDGFNPYGYGIALNVVLPHSYGVTGTIVGVYDISNRTRPILSGNVTVEGSHLSSRMIGDYIYAVINKPAYLQNNEVDLPTIYYNGHVVEIPASTIYYANVSDYYYTFTTMVAINVQNAKQEPAHQTFLLGGASNIYVSQKNIYITSPERADSTTIHKIGIEDGEITYVANGTVTGHVLNQFSMDEYKGYFRVATTKGRVWAGGTASQNNVYVLNESLGMVGRLEGLAPGEEIYSARFMGDRCYLVTFRKVDPLFVIDLKDPGNPRVLGKLKIPGYSDYLHPYDETHLIGVGKETVAAEEGDFSWYQGVKISLFDVSNVSKPKEVAKIEIGDRGTDSPALRDHKAFLFSKSKHLLALPILLAEIDEEKYPKGVPPDAHGDYVWQGAYVLNVSLDGGFVLRGRITHLEDEIDLMKSGYYFSSPLFVKRALYIGDVLYTISDKKIKMNSLETLVEIKAVELA